MDVTALHTAFETLAEYLSEMTHGDLGQSISSNNWDIGDLYVHLIDRNIETAAGLSREMTVDDRQRTDTTTRSALDHSANLYGGGYEEHYRRTARRVERAFATISDAGSVFAVDGTSRTATALYDEYVSRTVMHTWDLAQGLGFSYIPEPDVVLRLLRDLPEPPIDDVDAAWKAALWKSGRQPRGHSAEPSSPSRQGQQSTFGRFANRV